MTEFSTIKYRGIESAKLSDYEADLGKLGNSQFLMQSQSNQLQYEYSHFYAQP